MVEGSFLLYADYAEAADDEDDVDEESKDLKAKKKRRRRRKGKLRPDAENGAEMLISDEVRPFAIVGSLDQSSGEVSVSLGPCAQHTSQSCLDLS